MREEKGGNHSLADGAEERGIGFDAGMVLSVVCTRLRSKLRQAQR